MSGVSVEVLFSVDYPIAFNTWVGRFVGRLVPGGVYFFRVSFMCGFVDCSGAVDGFVKPEIRLLTGEVLRVVRASVRELGISIGGGESRSLITWSVRYWPTSFIFRSHYITWPSPARFLSSTAQTLSRLLRGGEALIDRKGETLVGVLNEVDLKGFVKELAFNTEVIGARVRRLVINLGRGRRVPAFEGVARYVTYTERPGLFKVLLDIANAYGVGKDRALGLGYVLAEIKDEARLRS
ncbi:MAG: CRISPR system precrRNA processing endoribonuclease RAMP protein Cas6 [Vulcanisaeta sp.]